MVALSDSQDRHGHRRRVSARRGPHIRRIIESTAAAFRAESGGISVEIKRLLLANSMKPQAGNKPLVDAIQKAKPAGAKGTYLQRAAISSTMGPGIKVNVGSIAG